MDAPTPATTTPVRRRRRKRRYGVSLQPYTVDLPPATITAIREQIPAGQRAQWIDAALRAALTRPPADAAPDDVPDEHIAALVADAVLQALAAAKRPKPRRSPSAAAPTE